MRYIVRDLLIWFTVLVLLPGAVFLVYYLATVDRSSVSRSLTQFREPSDAAASTTSELMKRVLLSESLCNDGSQATYYIRTSRTNSSMWLIVLEGGFFCYDDESCQSRAINSANLTSSRQTKRFRRGRGILASRPDENPFWFDANVVSIPYCSSDLWIGNKKELSRRHSRSRPGKLSKKHYASSSRPDFYFMGQKIVDDVLDDLVNVHSMAAASLVVLAGQSAGGIGALLNANRIKSNLERLVPQAHLKVVVDSSWLLNLPYSFLCNSLSAEKCFMDQVFSNSLSYWAAKLPEECWTEDENRWSCFLPYKLLPLIKVPVFVVQNLFDETLLMEQFGARSAARSVQINESLSFFKTLSWTHSKMKQTLSEANSVNEKNQFFIPSCSSHSILTRPEFSSYRMGKSVLGESLNCWARNECKHELDLSVIESCSWPDCDHSCPDLKHPDTSQSVDPIEYFSYVGLVNYRQVADVLGLSETVVRQMGYHKLMELVWSTHNF